MYKEYRSRKFIFVFSLYDWHHRGKNASKSNMYFLKGEVVFAITFLKALCEWCCLCLSWELSISKRCSVEERLRFSELLCPGPSLTGQMPLMVWSLGDLLVTHLHQLAQPSVFIFVKLKSILRPEWQGWIKLYFSVARVRPSNTCSRKDMSIEEFLRKRLMLIKTHLIRQRWISICKAMLHQRRLLQQYGHRINEVVKELTFQFRLHSSSVHMELVLSVAM